MQNKIDQFAIGADRLEQGIANMDWCQSAAWWKTRRNEYTQLRKYYDTQRKKLTSLRSSGCSSNTVVPPRRRDDAAASMLLDASPLSRNVILEAM